MSTAAGELQAIAEIFIRFADRECGAYAPTYDRLIRAAAGSPELLAIAAHVRPGVQKPNVFLAAANYLFGEELKALPPEEFIARCIAAKDEMAALCATRLVQTNEVRRSVALLPAMAHIARQTERPLALIEVGTSAGLLLGFDRYHIDYGEHGSTDPAGADLQLKTESRGAHPPLNWDPARLVHRVGIDLNPIRADDADAIRWLRALVWPDHAERRARLDAALAITAADPPLMIAGDAVEVLPDAVARLPRGTVPVMFHYATLAHFTPAARERFARLLDQLAASSEAGFAHLSAEAPSHQGHALELDLTLPGQATTSQRLANLHAHGEWIDWH